jgi:hypothetical protein
MTHTERQILDSLVELESAVAQMQTASPKPNLRSMFEHIEELSAALPPTADPLLLHYLRKKSYQKARLFLQGRDAENAAGNCHGHLE